MYFTVVPVLDIYGSLDLFVSKDFLMKSLTS